MIRSNHTPQHAPPSSALREAAWRLQRACLARPRLISNLLALVALFSVGFV